MNRRCCGNREESGARVVAGCAASAIWRYGELRTFLRVGVVAGALCGAVRSGAESHICRAEFAPGGQGLVLIHEALRGATQSVSVAMFYLSRNDLVDALCSVAQRGVNVRVLLDGEMDQTARRPILDRLAQAGAAVWVEDLPRNGKLHMKAAVVDGETVITGTANWTEAGFRQNYEDTLVVRSRSLAEAYEGHFNRLLDACRPIEYGDERSTPSRSILLPKRMPGLMKGAFALDRHWTTADRADVFFTPGRAGLEVFLDQARQATNRIVAARYIINDEQTITALCDIAQSGRCKVRVLVDQIMTGGTYLPGLQRLWEAGVDIRVAGGQRALMHLKSAVVDGRFTWTGSANWTKGALDVNAEDSVCVESASLAALYEGHLTNLLNRSDVFKGVTGSLQAPEPALGSHPAIGKMDWPTGLPPTGPRTKFTALFQDRPMASFTVNAWVSYLDDGAYLPVLLTLLNEARQTILITMYAIPETKEPQPSVQKVMKALESAAQRGVYVRLVLYMPLSPSMGLSAGHSKLAERLRARGIDVRLSVPGRPLHEKMVVVDLRKVIIGSHNWSEGALSGRRVLETSALLILTEQEPRFLEHVEALDTICDMRSPDHWEQEIQMLRHLTGLSPSARDQRSAELEQTVTAIEP